MKKTNIKKIIYLIVIMVIMNPVLITWQQAQATTMSSMGVDFPCTTKNDFSGTSQDSIDHLFQPSEQCQCCEQACEGDCSFQHMNLTIPQDFYNYFLHNSQYRPVIGFSVITNIPFTEPFPPRQLSL